MNKQVMDAIADGARLGVYKAHALFAPIFALLILALTPYWWLGLVLLVGAVLGWYGWYRDYGLKWNPWRR